jgi:hypothetical protein
LGFFASRLETRRWSHITYWFSLSRVIRNSYISPLLGTDTLFISVHAWKNSISKKI